MHVIYSVKLAANWRWDYIGNDLVIRKNNTNRQFEINCSNYATWYDCFSPVDWDLDVAVSSLRRLSFSQNYFRPVLLHRRLKCSLCMHSTDLSSSGWNDTIAIWSIFGYLTCVHVIRLWLHAISCCPDCVEFQSGSNGAGISAWDEA
jgi:hypothetical protein